MISIVVPIYNAEPYIQRCYECIVAQDFADWELILINDGSKDQSRMICDQIAQSDSRIKVINQENQGASVARRVGIENAKGEYLVFIDCDDIVENNYLSSLYNALNTTGKRVAACGVTKHPENENPQPQILKPATILNEEEIFERFFKYEFWGFVDKIYHKDVFKNLYFPIHTINEDYVVMLQLFNKEKEIAYVETPLYHYLIHPNSLSHQKMSKRALDEFYNKIWAYDYCKKELTLYVKSAEAQVTESCIKLIWMIKESKSTEVFLNEYKEMKSFLRKNIFSILFNPNLLLGLKFKTLQTIYA